MSNMIKTPMSEVKKLIDKYKNHVEFCDGRLKKSKENELTMSIALWIEERSAYKKVIIDLEKIILYEEPNTDLENPRP